ncbi:hypothetical protein [Methylobacterium sp. Leaf118]|uniref:hypothetical protein n=1 Tax=Methylobacterium sp. Leaf118 TaxID=2876562 RepID=UPI001E2AF5C2|nr:hypothetical protein [Methylobacterium sp. Leaf118]
MRRSLLLAATIAATLPGAPAGAAQRTPFETVRGWVVERTVGETGANPCLMTHAYTDKEDGNAANAVIFARDGDRAVLVLVYQGWAFDRGAVLALPLSLDGRAVTASIAWRGDGTTLRARLPEALVPDLLAARTLVLRFDDGDADFEIAGFGAGYEALRRCDAGAPALSPGGPPAAAVATPALPPRPRMAAYAVGLVLQRVLRDCRVTATPRQRAAVEDRLAALQPEMAAFETTVRSQLQAKGFRCPPADKEPEFQLALRRFIELSPEAFAAAMERQVEAETPVTAKP